jgi:hypothetical protein
MWTRRIDLNIVEPLANGFRFGEGLVLFKDRVHVIPQAADDLKAIAREKLEWLNGRIEGREFIVGDRFTLADVLLFAFLEFGAAVGQPLDAKLENLQGWYTRVASRPSIEASKSRPEAGAPQEALQVIPPSRRCIREGDWPLETSAQAVGEPRRVLRPGSRLIVTGPAFGVSILALALRPAQG